MKPTLSWLGASLCVSDQPYELVIAPSARRQLTEQLPEAVAFAAYEFIVGPLLDNTNRVGKRLRLPASVEVETT